LKAASLIYSLYHARRWYFTAKVAVLEQAQLGASSAGITLNSTA
jgi:hypothetical protein